MITIYQRHGQTTCDRNTALCTKVHRAVKTGLETTDSRQGLNMSACYISACSSDLQIITVAIYM